MGYATPTVMFNVATACLGNVGHSWQNTAFAGSEIGRKGMLRAAEVLTLAAVRTMEQPELIAKAREELLAKRRQIPLPAPRLHHPADREILNCQKCPTRASGHFWQ